jgi:hypothetical protein
MLTGVVDQLDVSAAPAVCFFISVSSIKETPFFL